MSGWLAKLGLGLKKSSQKISGGISDIFTKKRIDAETLEGLEDLLISADMGVKASAKITAAFGKKRFDKELDEKDIRRELAAEIEKILKPWEKSLIIGAEKKPFVVLMVGVNGAGKTTTIGKLTSKLSAQGKKVSMIAGDTFRAAAVEQLQVWGKRCGVRVFAKETGADAASVAYEGLQEAVKCGDDVVFIDTAGRLQNKAGLGQNF